MKKPSEKSEDKSLVSVLKQLTKRTEEATVDIHDMKRDLKFIKLRLGSVEHNTELTKVDTSKLEENITKFRDDIFNRLDDISAQLEGLREDRIIGAHQTRELREEVDDHTKRITHLEKSHPAA